MFDVVNKSQYWKCDSCKEIHDAGRPITGEQADKRLVCCPTGIFMSVEENEVED